MDTIEISKYNTSTWIFGKVSLSENLKQGKSLQVYLLATTFIMHDEVYLYAVNQ